MYYLFVLLIFDARDLKVLVSGCGVMMQLMSNLIKAIKSLLLVYKNFNE